jgi:hypothetical protein
MDPLSRAVTRAVKDAPLSLRDIARRANVSHVLLVGIIAGNRAATAPVAEAVARALEGVSRDCAKRAGRIWPHLPGGN